MEKKGLVSNSLKDHAGIVTRAIRRSKTTYEEDDYNFDGFAWPPRSYTCSFCKREFRSAQALGGHMNVHRKDRARLKGSPPRDSQYTTPPPVFLVPSSENMKWVVGDTLFNHPLNFKASDFGTTVKKNAESFCGVGDRQCDGFIGEEHGCIKTVKAADHPHHPIVRLDLEIGMLGDSNKEDLDLELRLGYS
ncbi:hypothetical protein ACFX1T_012591 [Malus domestica]